MDIRKFFAATILLVYSNSSYAFTSYHIGNSLTWDLQPPGISAMATLTGKSLDVGYHIRSGMHLDYLWNNPDDVTSTNSFGSFTNALASYEWDYVTIQPYYRFDSTMSLDQQAINNFINFTLSGPSQSTIFYIYSAWPSLQIDYQTYWDQLSLNAPDEQTIHVRDYFNNLHQNVKNDQSSSVQIFMIPVGEVFYRLDQEIDAGNIPELSNVGDLYRDSQHITRDIGRFVAATTAYATIFRENPSGIDRPSNHFLNIDGSTALTDDLRIRLQSIIWDVVSHHPSSGVDISPDIFNFDNKVEAPLNTIIVSNTINVTGINAATEIQIIGGEYAINNGSYTSTPGHVSNSDTVAVRSASLSTFSSTKEVTLTIGDASGTFNITTLDNGSTVNNSGTGGGGGCVLTNQANNGVIDISLILALMIPTMCFVAKTKIS